MSNYNEMTVVNNLRSRKSQGEGIILNIFDRKLGKYNIILIGTVYLHYNMCSILKVN